MFKMIIWLICLPISLTIILIGFPISCLIEICIYIVTGKDNELDIVFAPIEWALELPYKITDKF